MNLLRPDLLIVDDMLPSEFSPFRTVEYEHYLGFFDAVLLSTGRWHRRFPDREFAGLLADLSIDPALKPRILPFTERKTIKGRIAYVTFASNAARYFPFFEKRRLPFILQLYPGGGFAIDQPEVDQRLRTVLLSPLCRKVITTQTLTRDYVVDRIGCDPAKVEFIYGGVFDSRVDFDFHRDKQLYPRDKQTRDICFVAHKYSNQFTSKGYDQFVAIAQRLAPTGVSLRFHVVGEYTDDDLPLGEAADRFTFYGARDRSFFTDFYPRMDLIISINRPFVLSGAFDGFPTGACMEAGFRGVLNCINDPLGLNGAFVHERDLVLLDFDQDRSVALLRNLLKRPERLYELAYSNWRQFHAVFDVNRQLWARSRIITAELLRRDGANAAGSEFPRQELPVGSVDLPTKINIAR